jgi:hypothetical protein
MTAVIRFDAGTFGGQRHNAFPRGPFAPEMLPARSVYLCRRRRMAAGPRPKFDCAAISPVKTS